MPIIFKDWDDWNEIIAKVKLGLVLCPKCNKWVNTIYKIPHRLAGLLELMSGTDYCCDYCMSKLADDYAKRPFLKCNCCGHNLYQGEYKRISIRWFDLKNANYCNSCIEDLRVAELIIKWSKKEEYRVNNNNTRTKDIGLTGNLSLEQWFSILRKYQYKCAYCGDDYSELDHVIPVSKGGGTSADNVVPTCRKCNARKHNYDVDFMRVSNLFVEG